MAKSKKGSRKTTKNHSPDTTNNINQDGHGSKDMIWVDPIYVRFQHSKIRPVFSTCGRTLVETLNSIRDNEIAPSDLPPIQVLIGPETNDGQHRWYFSLNNRRLWVLKRCREEGLLLNNKILVRVREPKSQSEIQRYTIQNCAIEAKIVREKEKKQETSTNENQRENSDRRISNNLKKIDVEMSGQEDDISDDSNDDDTNDDRSNRFSALF